QVMLDGFKWHTEVSKCPGCSFAAAWRALDKTFHDEERLIHFFNGAGIFPNCCGDGRNPYWTSAKCVDDGREDTIVHFIQPKFIDLQCIEGMNCDFFINGTVAFNLGEVAYPSEQGIGDTRCSS